MPTSEVRSRDTLQAAAWRDLFAQLEREARQLEGARTEHTKGMLAGIALVRQCMQARESAILSALDKLSDSDPKGAP